MIKAIIFDFYGVLTKETAANQELLDYINRRLKSKYKLGILSNALDDLMYEIIGTQNVNDIFDDVVISYKAGVGKPDPEVYKISLKNLGVKPEEAIFIDDIERYCQAAEALGIHTICYGGFEQMKSELELLLSVSDN